MTKNKVYTKLSIFILSFLCIFGSAFGGTLSDLTGSPTYDGNLMCVAGLEQTYDFAGSVFGNVGEIRTNNLSIENAPAEQPEGYAMTYFNGSHSIGAKFVADGVSSSYDLSGSVLDNVGEINNVYYVTEANVNGIKNTMDNCDGITTCKVKMPCGIIDLDDDLVLNKSNMILEGEGECTIINKTWWDHNIINDRNLSNIVIKNFVFEGQYTDESTLVLPIRLNYSVENIEISGIHIKNFNGTAIDVKGNHIKVHDNFFDNVLAGFGTGSDKPHNGIFYDIQIYDNKFVNNDMYSNSTSTWGEGIEINHHNQTGVVIIENNYFEGFQENHIDCNLQQCIVVNNEFVMDIDESRTNQAVQISSVGDYYSYGIVSNNIISNVNGGDCAILFHKANSGSIIGNQIIGANRTDGRGIRLSDNSKNIKIIGNHMTNLSIGIKDESLANSGIQIFANDYDNVGTSLVSYSTTYYRLDNTRTSVFNSQGYNDVLRLISNDSGAFINFADDSTYSSNFFQLGAIGNTFALKINDSIEFEIESDGDLDLNNNNINNLNSITNDIEINGATDNDVLRLISSDAGAYINFVDSNTYSNTFFQLGALGNTFALKINNSIPFKIEQNGDKIFLPKTTQFGDLSHPACLKIADSDGGGYTYCRTLDGVMTCNTTSCE